MWIMPQLAVMQVLSKGVAEIKSNIDMLDEVFAYMCEDGISDTYGVSYIGQIKTWFQQTKIPVMSAWNITSMLVPCISVHLSSELEDESKAAISDYFGESDLTTTGIAVMNVTLDIGIFAPKTGDQVLWLYYITSYILFRYKRQMEGLGLHLQTYSTSDWERRNEYNVENVWTRWLKLRCITQNTWNLSTKQEYDVYTDVFVESESDLVDIDGD